MMTIDILLKINNLIFMLISMKQEKIISKIIQDPSNPQQHKASSQNKTKYARKKLDELNRIDHKKQNRANEIEHNRIEQKDAKPNFSKKKASKLYLVRCSKRP